jgi:hypothetical protein
MQLFWGQYRFPINGASTTSKAEATFSASGRPLRYIIKVGVLAYLDGDGPADLSFQENALRAALAIPYQDLILKLDTGQASSTQLLNATSVSGVRVVSGPDFTNDAKDSEYVTQRTARFEVAAEYLIRGTENALVSFTESVTVTGNGGPDRNWRFPINGPPIRQVVTPYSLITASQSGTAVGHTTRPVPPPPLWPDYLVNPRHSHTKSTPEPHGRAWLNWPVKWSYSFESDVPLVAMANLPPM